MGKYFGGKALRILGMPLPPWPDKRCAEDRPMASAAPESQAEILETSFRICRKAILVASGLAALLSFARRFLSV